MKQIEDGNVLHQKSCFELFDKLNYDFYEILFREARINVSKSELFFAKLNSRLEKLNLSFWKNGKYILIFAKHNSSFSNLNRDFSKLKF